MKQLKKESKIRLVTGEQFAKILTLFNDEVYRIIAVVTWYTGFFPKDLLRLPYLGSGINSGLREYGPDELSSLSSEVLYKLDSKGRAPHTYMSGEVWEFICEHWMPERMRRAMRYQAKHGVTTCNKHLFLAIDGTPVSYKMLYNHFSKILTYPGKPFGLEYFTPTMLCNSFTAALIHSVIESHDLLYDEDLYVIVSQAVLDCTGRNISKKRCSLYVQFILESADNYVRTVNTGMSESLNASFHTYVNVWRECNVTSHAGSGAFPLRIFDGTGGFVPD